MHFLVGATGCINIKHDRREDTRHARRRDEHVHEQLPGRFATATGDRTKIPDHGLLAVEIGCCGKQHSPVGRFPGNGIDEFTGDEMVDQSAQ